MANGLQRCLDRQRIRQPNPKGLLKNSERLHELEDNTSAGSDSGST
jgi:hypothetical protein